VVDTSEHNQVASGTPTTEYNPALVQPVLGHARKLDSLRETYQPFFRSSFRDGFWVFTDSDAIRDGLQHPDLFSSRSVDLYDPDPQYLWIPEMLDPPEHTRWRQLLAPLFSPGAVARMEDGVRRTCVEMVESFAGRGGCDFHADFAYRYPTTVFMDLMGLDRDGLEQFLLWEDAILHTPINEDPDQAKQYQAMVDVQAYFAELLEARRRDPREDLATAALGWRIDGEPIPEDELLAFCLLMFMAGLDTVAIQLSYSWWHLATHDQDRARIVAEPEVIPTAVEELLRVYSFVPTQRKATQDVTFHGCPITAGQMVQFPIPAACRDPKSFPDAATVVLDRTPNNHIAFGLGPHRCLGSHLARRELRIAMEEWHTRIPDYRLDPEVEVLEHGGMFGIDSLALLWDA